MDIILKSIFVALWAAIICVGNNLASAQNPYASREDGLMASAEKASQTAEVKDYLLSKGKSTTLVFSAGVHLSLTDKSGCHCSGCSPEDCAYDIRYEVDGSNIFLFLERPKDYIPKALSCDACQVITANCTLSGLNPGKYTVYYLPYLALEIGAGY
jgi:hypothetical protein